MLRLHIFQGGFYFRPVRQGAHPRVVNRVVLAKPLALFKISPCNVGCSLRRDHLRIVYDPVAEPSPFQMHAKIIGRFAKRRLLENFVKLRQFRQLGRWRRRRWRRDGRILLVRFVRKIDSRPGRFLRARTQRAAANHQKQNKPEECHPNEVIRLTGNFKVRGVAQRANRQAEFGGA